MEHAVTKTEFLVVDVMEAENQNVIITNKGDFFAPCFRQAILSSGTDMKVTAWKTGASESWER